jgi:alkyl hydroperoxide reductase subunit D
VLRKHGMTTEQIQAGLRIGAVVHGIAQTLRAEAAAA